MKGATLDGQRTDADLTVERRPRSPHDMHTIPRSISFGPSCPLAEGEGAGVGRSVGCELNVSIDALAHLGLSLWVSGSDLLPGRCSILEVPGPKRELE